MAAMPRPDYLMIDNDATLWVTHRVSATPTSLAPKRRVDIAFHLRNRTFSDIFVFQRFNVNPDTGALRYGRIPGARHMMFEELLNADKSFKPAADVRAALTARGAGPERDTIAYCRMSHRATVLYFALTELAGIDNVRVYDGSWTEWGNLVGVPVER